MTLYKTNARLKRERNDRVIAATYVQLRNQYPAESKTNLMMTIATLKDMPYNSLAGVRNSLLRSKTI